MFYRCEDLFGYCKKDRRREAKDDEVKKGSYGNLIYYIESCDLNPKTCGQYLTNTECHAEAVRKLVEYQKAQNSKSVSKRKVRNDKSANS